MYIVLKGKSKSKCLLLELTTIIYRCRENSSILGGIKIQQPIASTA